MMIHHSQNETVLFLKLRQARDGALHHRCAEGDAETAAGNVSPLHRLHDSNKSEALCLMLVRVSTDKSLGKKDVLFSLLILI